jgi:hypothetical protein
MNDNQMNTSDNRFKVLFRFYSDLFDEEMVETMWATSVDAEKGLYKLDNIPFYAPSVASGDIVFAEFDDAEEMLTYRSTKEHWGNSTIQVALMDKSIEINEIREIFAKLGCVSEKVNEGYFSMEIPFSVDYKKIKYELDQLEEKETIGYAESSLSEKHRSAVYHKSKTTWWRKLGK